MAIGQRIMNQFKNVMIPIIVIVASVQITLLFPLVDARAVLYSPDTKVPRTGEVALRRAIPANANMKSIQVVVALDVCLF